MSVLIASSVARTCLGTGPQTYASLLRGECAVTPLRHVELADLCVRHGYQIPDPGTERPLRATGWLVDCVRDAVLLAGIDPRRQRVAALVGTGMRELRGVERWALDGFGMSAADLHFGPALSAAAGVRATTISNACSAGGHALALGQDLIELGEADAVIVAGADSLTESMLAMIGRFADQPTDRVRPFDAERTGALLGEGAAALILVGEDHAAVPPLARLLGTGLSCDARHETAPDQDGIQRAMRDALERADRDPGEIDLVIAHGTGTLLNDPTEAAALAQVFGVAAPGPLITAVKGAVGHTSGASALTSLAIGIHSMERGAVPPVVGLREPLPEGTGLRFVVGSARPADVRVFQVDAFGFGGVNSVSLVAAA